MQPTKLLLSGLGLVVLAFCSYVQSAQKPIIEGSTNAEFQGRSPIRGPYFSDPVVMSMLDRLSSDGDCAKSGKLVFGCLIQRKDPSNHGQPIVGALSNPFNLRVASDITKTIKADLESFRREDSVESDQQLNPAFLTHPDSRIELVGIVNRIDRQFIHDRVPGSENHKRCGEISVVYRFSYSLRNGDIKSRLPVTMNIVFPAIPRSMPAGASTCADIANRWISALRTTNGRAPEDVYATLNDPKDGVISLLDGKDIERIELNMQAYRISAGSDETDFGSTAEYVIRVFRWNPDREKFTVSYLTNQIERARLLGNDKGDQNSCEPGVARHVSKEKFLRYLTDPVVISDIDTGTLNIPQEFLACRAVSGSPGGPHRSKNSLFWNAPNADEQVITDAEIQSALSRAESPNRQFSFIKSVNDFRLRLNQMTCTGCHQARAIAGFHFPGIDRPGTPVSNAVLLPGSPHFYGDQPRRTMILEQLAKGSRLTRYELATSYSSRPLNKFKEELSQTELIGGWGGACLLAEEMSTSKRRWDCTSGLQCVALFNSKNAPGLGVCVPKAEKQIGNALQIGNVTTIKYGHDFYLRTAPKPVGNWSDKENRNTLIAAEFLPAVAPAGNSYYGAHQEFYKGDPSGGQGAPEERYRVKRDALTGGFPSGMLRLSECINLPSEATCGLVASSGFNTCLDKVKDGAKTLAQCFQDRTSYAGMRACDVSNPCRDDYICLQPMGYNLSNGHKKFLERQNHVSGIYDPADFGQQEPDLAWLGRNSGQGDQRGICIPPYFVFQFRSDGHPAPMAITMKRRD